MTVTVTMPPSRMRIMLRRASRTSPERYAASFQPPNVRRTKIIARPNEPPDEVPAGFACAPAIRPAMTRNASPAKSRICMTFCKPLDSTVPATFSAVRAMTPSAA
jgi:hypothetical protein